MLWPQYMVKCFLVANRKNVSLPPNSTNSSVVEYRRK